MISCLVSRAASVFACFWLAHKAAAQTGLFASSAQLPQFL